MNWHAIAARLIVGAILLVPTTAAEPALMAGGDASHSGVRTADLPRDEAVLLRLALGPHDPYEPLPPLITEDGVFIARVIADLRPVLGFTAGTATVIVEQIDFDDGSVRELATVPMDSLYGLAWAADATMLYLHGAREVVAIAREAGVVDWRLTVPTGRAPPTDGLSPSCPDPAIEQGILLIACGGTGSAGGPAFVAAVDVVSGALLWCKQVGAWTDCGSPGPSLAMGRPSLDNGMIFVPWENANGFAALTSLDLRSGDVRASTVLGLNLASILTGDAERGVIDPIGRTAAPAVVATKSGPVLFGRDRIAGLTADTLETRFGANLGGPRTLSATGITGNDVYVVAGTAEQSFVVDGRSGLVRTRLPVAEYLPPSDVLHDVDGAWMIAIGGVLKFVDWDGEQQIAIPVGGELGSYRMNGGEGRIVVVHQNQPSLTATVLGHGGAGIGLPSLILDEYPAVGRDVTVDLNATRPGVQADDLRFRVDWGDGNVDLGEESAFRHAYSEPGPVVMRIEAMNSAGQSDILVQELLVGGAAPNFISNSFSPENQESTFFILGIFVILLGSAFGAVRLRRKRGRLRRELAAADAVITGHQDDADAIRDGLAEHRRRAQRLFLEGRLDEGSTSILRGHIDDLLRHHRLSKVEGDLSFLPHGLFRTMQEMLRDARVTQLERNNFLAALASEKQLTVAQKARVERHVETWHREDEA